MYRLTINKITAIVILVLVATTNAKYASSFRERENDNRESLKKEYGDIEKLLERFIETERSKSENRQHEEVSVPAKFIVEKSVKQLTPQLRGTGSTISLSQTDKNLIVQLHNQARQTVSNPAPANPLQTMYWNNTLEHTAVSYAKKCIFGHNPDNGNNVGENIFVTSATTGSAASLVDVGVKSWLKENDYWDNFVCNPPKYKSCGHYTQIIWDATTQVGCSLARCTSFTNLPWDGGHELVCNYYTAGNVYRKVDDEMVMYPPYAAAP